MDSLGTDVEQVQEWSIDWGWYDEIVAEYDEMVRKEKEEKENLLIDFDSLATDPPPTAPSVPPPPSTFEKELASLF